MKIYYFQQKQLVKADIDRVWDFFSSPKNLNKITPPFMNFEILDGLSAEVFEGQLITYKVTPLPFFRVKWITEITEVDPKNFFADKQKKGPFSLWHHEHNFTETDAGVEMEDHVIYAIPFGFLGRIANTLFVQRQVQQIFDYRRQRIEKLFS